MNQFRIVTDGACDLPQAWCRAHQIAVIPLYCSIASAVPRAYPGSRPYPMAPFYEMLRQGTPVHTSAPSIDDCKECLRPLLRKGYDLLYTGLSAQLSGMFNVMRLAAMELGEEFPERHIRVIDSGTGSFALGLLIRELTALRENGTDLDTVCEIAEHLRTRIGCWFTVSDLMYLKRGGRISGSVAMVGTVLQIMPMLHVTPEGTLAAYGKVRGRKNALRCCLKRA